MSSAGVWSLPMPPPPGRLAAPGLYHPSTRRKLPRQLLCETLAEAISQALLNTGELRALSRTLSPPLASCLSSRHPTTPSTRDRRVERPGRVSSRPGRPAADAERTVTRVTIEQRRR